MRAAITALTLFRQYNALRLATAQPTSSAVVAAGPREFIMVVMALRTAAGRHMPCNT